MGIKKNILYTSILTTSNYIFPLVVYPYVARVLGVTNIGLCNFIDSVINYFILFSMMGIAITGNRRIATARARNENLDSPFSSLFALNAVTTTIALGALIAAVFIVPTLYENRELMWFGIIKLLGNFMLIEWFYKGIEDFRYITQRTIIVKCLYVASIFIFVREAEDYPIYYLLTVSMVGVNALINLWHSRKFARLRLKLIKLKEVAKPFFLLGVYMLVTSFCTTFNVVFLGFTTNDTQVGYYTTAIKLYSILLAFFTGVTSVMLPRMSNLLAQGKHEEFKSLLSKTRSILFDFSIPFIVLAVIFAPQIIMLLSGPGYEGAILPMRIVMPMILIIGYEQILVIQALMPLHKDKLIMRNACVGAFVSIMLNIILVKYLMSVGSAITWFVSESVILILSQILLNKFINLGFPFEKFTKTVIWNIPLAAILIFIYNFAFSEIYWVYLILSGIITMVYTFIVQILVFKNSFLIETIGKFRNKLLPNHDIKAKN